MGCYSSRGNGIKNMATLSAWECGSHLYGLQELEVYLYPVKSEYEAKKMARIDQGLWARSVVPLGEGECGCWCIESQDSLQLLASHAYYWRGIYNPSVTRVVIIQHHPLLAVLKSNRIIRKRIDANCSSFHLRVFIGLSNPQGQRQTSSISIPCDNFGERKAKFNIEMSRITQMQLYKCIHIPFILGRS
jgi:hypothetical protein